jgi:chemotaxis protein methyltransferase CheR
MTTGSYDFIRRQLRQTVGISIELDKLHTIENRLEPLAQQSGLKSVPELIDLYRTTRDHVLWRQIVEAMTTNETYFFRDRKPFSLFREQMLPRLLEARSKQRHLRIWCAACSTGQEPYSLAMILDEEARHLKGWKVEIVATDLSEGVLATARDGLYSQFEVQRGLPVTLLLRYFKREGERWRINEALRSRVQFRPQNLLADFRELGTFDVIFCRNVLIYFDAATKSEVLGKLCRSVRPDGYLVLGAAETVLGLCPDWVPHPGHPAMVVPAGSPELSGPSKIRLVSGL